MNESIEDKEDLIRELQVQVIDQKEWNERLIIDHSLLTFYRNTYYLYRGLYEKSDKNDDDISKEYITIILRENTQLRADINNLHTKIKHLTEYIQNQDIRQGRLDELLWELNNLKSMNESKET